MVVTKSSVPAAALARRSSQSSGPLLSVLTGASLLGLLWSFSFLTLLWRSAWVAAGDAASGSLANSTLLLPSVFSALFFLGTAGAVAMEAELVTAGLVGVVLGAALLFSALVQDITLLATRGSVGSDVCACNTVFYAANSSYCTAVSAVTIIADVALLIVAFVGAVHVQRLQRALRLAALSAASPLLRDSGKVAWEAKGYANVSWTKPRLATIPELDETSEKP